MRTKEPFADEVAERLLDLAVEAENWNILCVLLKRQVSHRQRILAFQAVVEAQRIDVARDILALTAYLNLLVNNAITWPDHQPNPLLLASAARNLDLIRILMDRGFSPNLLENTNLRYSSNFLQPLSAAISGQTEIDFRFRFSWYNFDCTAFDDRETSAQQLVDMELIRALVNGGADVNASNIAPYLGGETLSPNEVPIHAAITLGHVNTVRYLLDSGANLHSTPMAASSLQVLFANSIRINNAEAIAIAKELIMHGSNVNETFKWDRGDDEETIDSDNHEWPQTPLCCAARRGSYGLVRLLIESGAVQMSEALFQAVKGRHCRVAEFLLDLGTIPVDFRQILGEASRANMQPVVDKIILLAQKDNDRWNFAHIGSNVKSAQLLLSSGAIPENQQQLEDIIDAAIRGRSIPFVRQILDVAIENQENWDLSSLQGLSTAISIDNPDIAQILIHFGAHVGFESISTALKKKNLPLVKHLMDSESTAPRFGRHAGLQ